MPSTSASSRHRSRLRQTLRAQRCSLSPEQQARAADSAWQRLIALPAFQQARRIAAYQPQDGEICPWPGLDEWPGQSIPTPTPGSPSDKHLFLPVVEDQALSFCALLPGAEAVRLNQFGIAEPMGPRLPGTELDLIIMPLVGFDGRGNRLGMGGGFYDRTFAAQQAGGPLLIGLAHNCQHVPALAAASWDIPMAAIVTPAAVIYPSGN